MLIANGIKLVRVYGNINKFLPNLLSEDNSDYINYHLFLKVASISLTKIEILVKQHSLIPFLRLANIKKRRPSNWDGEYKALAFRFIKKRSIFVNLVSLKILIIMGFPIGEDRINYLVRPLQNQLN